MSQSGGFAVRSRARAESPAAQAGRRSSRWGADRAPARLSAQGVAAESEQVTYYAHIVERAGLPVGIHELTAAQQVRTEVSYKFVRRGGVLLAPRPRERQRHAAR